MVYTTIWRNKFITTDADTLEEMIDKLHKAAHCLEAMAQDGVQLEGGQEEDYARLTTSDPVVAKRYGMSEENEDEIEIPKHELDTGA